MEYKDRPELQSMVKGLRKGDVVTTTKNDRLARRMSDFFNLTEEINEASAGLVSLDGAIDTSVSTPRKDILWQLLVSIAEFERKLISSRGVKRVEQEQRRLANFWQTLHMKSYRPLKRVWVLIK